MSTIRYNKKLNSWRNVTVKKDHQNNVDLFDRSFVGRPGFMFILIVIVVLFFTIKSFL